MEGSGENFNMNFEDDKALSDKKRREVKTPSQVEALEKFYGEYKYPPEFMKRQLAGKIGLTERQVNCWFCHRRVKDKKLLNGEMHENGRLDRASGVVQDSCGSTKQGEMKTLELIEVQSSRFKTQQLSAPGLKVEHGSNQAGKCSSMDNTSSGSSPSPHKLLLKVDHVHMTASKLSAQNVGTFLNFGKPRSAPSGYLKVKPRLENPAVAAIKMQLGARYRDDGPPLTTEFDALPPGAFEPLPEQQENTVDSSETFSVEEHVAGLSKVSQGIHQECMSKPYRTDEHNLLHSDYGSRTHKKQIPNVGFGCTPNLSFPVTVLDGKSSEKIHKSVQSESFFFQGKQEFPLSERRSLDMHENSQPDMAIYDRRNSYKSRTMRTPDGSLRGAPAVYHQFPPYRGGDNKEHEEPRLKNSNGRMPTVVQRDSINSSSSDFIVRNRGNDAYGDKGLPLKEEKVGSFYGVKKGVDDVVSDRLKKPRKIKINMVKDEYTQHVRKI